MAVNNSKSYFNWLSKKMDKFDLIKVQGAHNYIEEYCFKENIIKKPLTQIDDMEVLKEVKNTVMHDYLFRKGCTNNKKYPEKAISFYIQYVNLSNRMKNNEELKELKQKKKNKKKQKQKQKENIKVEPKHEEVKSKYETIVKNEPIEEKTLDETQEEQDFIIEFNALNQYADITPVKYSYFGVVRSEFEGWQGLYVDLIKLLYADYDYIFIGMVDQCATKKGSRLPDIRSKKNDFGMISPVALTDSFVIETGYNLVQILCIIKNLLDKCLIDYDNLKIYYEELDVEPVEEIEIENPVETIDSPITFELHESVEKEEKYQKELIDYSKMKCIGDKVPFGVLSRAEASTAMDEWTKNYPNLPTTSGKLNDLRSDLVGLFKIADSNLDKSMRKYNYYLDIDFGILLYDYFNNIENFTLRKAADDNFWRYLSLKVIPDIIAKRWDFDNEDHYWKRVGRIWLKNIWWTVNLAWQGDAIKTKELLRNNCFDSVTILELIDRIGGKGAYIDVYRVIVRQFFECYENGLIQKNVENTEKVFRFIMKIHTAKVLVIEPELFEGGVEGYVESLFVDAGVKEKVD